MSPTDFSSLPLQADLLHNLSSLGYLEMTPIQAQSLPPILAGQDVIAQAKTGSGKTAAFGLGLLQRLEVKHFSAQSLVLCPTRELADQVAKEMRMLARTIPNIKVLTLCGGVPLGPQVDSLGHGVHIIVGTPGRVEKHLDKQTLHLDNLKMLVLDEADRMLAMGFQDSIDAIIGKTPVWRQTLLFSATYPKQIKSIANRVMRKPVTVQIMDAHDDTSIEQHFYKVTDNVERLMALRLLLLKYHPESALVFANTKIEVRQIAENLVSSGFSAQALHGDLEQKDRDQTLLRFANKSVVVLVATDVAARGLDIKAIDLVLNYHLARDAEVHVHRIGRTGRAGSKGMACSLYTDQDDYKIALLSDTLDKTIESEALPSMDLLKQLPAASSMRTMQITGGKKQKLRPGDILGALTSAGGIEGHQVGKIHILDNHAYVAIERKFAQKAFKKLSQDKLKGRSFRVRLI